MRIVDNLSDITGLGHSPREPFISQALINFIKELFQELLSLSPVNLSKRGLC